MSPAQQERAAAEQKITLLEKRLAMAQLKIVRHVAAALTAMATRERQEEIRVQATLRTLTDEVAQIRQQIEALTAPQTPN